jgi:hypothetical protein
MFESASAADETFPFESVRRPERLLVGLPERALAA